MSAVAVVTVSPETFLAIVAVSALSGTLAAISGRRGIGMPVVVIELLLGIVIGPHVLGLRSNEFTTFFSDLGLGLLFFFAGYEIDLRRIQGQPLRLALLGWALSLALAYTIGGVLATAGVVLSLAYTGSAMATTAMGTLIPMLSDAGELRTRFGTHVVAAGAVGEFGPILLLTLVLSAKSTLHHAILLLAFVALAAGGAVFAVRYAERPLQAFERTLEHSSQLVVRWILVLVFALALLAIKLGLDLLLGAFAGGLIAGVVLKGHELPAVQSKLTAVAFGVFVPFFFVVSGMNIDITALFVHVSDVLMMLFFLVMFLVVRGAPALLLYRKVLGRRQRSALALMSATQLPLVLAITALAADRHDMRASTAAALVGAAVLSTLIFPVLGLRVRGEHTSRVAPAALPQVAPDPVPEAS